VAGIEVSYSVFAYPNFEGIRGISMIIIFLAWVILLGSVMLKKTSTKGF